MENPFYKDVTAFISGGGACYRPGHAGQQYTRADFFAIAGGDEKLAHALFEQAAGETPEQLLEALFQKTPGVIFPPLPIGNLDAYRPLSDSNGRYFDSQSLDAVLLAGGAAISAALQGMLDGQYGRICLRNGQPGILFCKAYHAENEHTADDVARGYGFLPAEFPEVEAFVCSNAESAQTLLCVWLAAGALSGERLQQLLALYE